MHATGGARGGAGPSAPTWRGSMRSTQRATRLRAGGRVSRAPGARCRTSAAAPWSHRRAMPELRRPGARGARSGRRDLAARSALRSRAGARACPRISVLFAPTLVRGEPVGGAVRCSGGGAARARSRARDPPPRGRSPAQIGPRHGERRARPADRPQAARDGDPARSEPHGVFHARSSTGCRASSCATWRARWAPTPSGSGCMRRVGRVARCRSWAITSRPDRLRGRRAPCASRASPAPVLRRGGAHAAAGVLARRVERPPLPGCTSALVPHRSQLFVPIVAKDRMVGGFAAVWWDRARDLGDGELRADPRRWRTRRAWRWRTRALFRDNRAAWTSSPCSTSCRAR